MKDGFRFCPRLRQASPPRIAASSSGVATLAFPNEIDVGMIRVGRPMLLKVSKKRGPVLGQTVFLEIFQRKRETVIDTYQYRLSFAQSLNEPLGNRPARPMYF